MALGMLCRWRSAIVSVRSKLPPNAELLLYEASLFTSQPYSDNFRQFQQQRGHPLEPLPEIDSLPSLPAGVEIDTQDTSNWLQRWTSLVQAADEKLASPQVSKNCLIQSGLSLSDAQISSGKLHTILPVSLNLLTTLHLSSASLVEVCKYCIIWQKEMCLQIREAAEDYEEGWAISDSALMQKLAEGGEPAALECFRLALPCLYLCMQIDNEPQCKCKQYLLHTNRQPLPVL